MDSTRKSAVIVAPRPDRRWLWVRTGESPASGTLEELASWYGELPGSPGLILLVPGEDVLLAAVDIPTRNPRRISRALPYALEEHVLDEPSRLHSVAGPRLDGGAIACAAISRDRLSNLLGQLRGAGLAPDHACPDCLCVPWTDGEVHVVTSPERSLVRWGACAAAAGEGEFVETIVDGLRSRDGGVQVTHHRYADEADQFEALAARAGREPIDLLEGEFLPKHRQAGWPAWKMPAALAAGVWLLLTGTPVLQAWRLDTQSGQLSAAIRQQFSEAFPRIERIQADPAPQVELELRRLHLHSGAGKNPFLELMSRTAPVLAGSPGIRLERLRYRDGSLELELSAGRIADLDGLSLRLQAGGVAAIRGAARLDEDQVSGVITVTAGTPGAGR